MSELSVARRYAKSLLDLAVEQGKLDRIMDDIISIHGSFESRDLVLLLKSPIIKSEKKMKALSTIFQGKVDDLTLRFIEILTKKGREGILPEIAEAVREQYNELKNITSATLTTAVKVDSEVVKNIESKIKGKEGSVEISTEVDPSILGGYILQIGDKVYDASVEKKINDLRKELTNG